MAIVNGYTDLDSVKQRLGLDDPQDDLPLSAVIAAASRAIDGYCARRFYQITATRYFTAEEGGYVDLDDLVSLTALATDISGTRQYTTTWLASDYDLTPDNAADIGWPYTAIRQRPFTTLWFPTLRKSVQIAGVWGWPAVPDAVAEACVIQAIRLFKRAQAPFGIAGSGELGMVQTIPRLDPDVRALLDPYRRLAIGAV